MERRNRRNVDRVEQFVDLHCLLCLFETNEKVRKTKKTREFFFDVSVAIQTWSCFTGLSISFILLCRSSELIRFSSEPFKVDRMKSEEIRRRDEKQSDRSIRPSSWNHP